ncbi:hypothetical protein [Nitrosomonas sp. Nm84]|uniref:hypothetical protein n=1 Tax=Nitrosomonas sp. Nm84 TaxID=200124 RepID=UPI000D75A4CE|nr:hypothetical protein [Nitrosomonas sp. Nm84]
MFIRWKIKFSGGLFQIVSVAMANIQEKRCVREKIAESERVPGIRSQSPVGINLRQNYVPQNV